jgi:GNAT superfamily N-acetyltransferase
VQAAPVLRLAAPLDVPAVQSLINASVRALSIGYYTDAQIDEALVSIFGVDTQLLSDGTYFVIELGSVLAAAGGWSKRATLYGGDQTKGAIDPLLDPLLDAARIRAFFVAPEFARQGLARQLYNACEHAALHAGFRRFQLGATLPGVPLYHALGFTALEQIESPMRFGLSLPIVRMERAIGNTT